MPDPNETAPESGDFPGRYLTPDAIKGSSMDELDRKLSARAAQLSRAGFPEIGQLVHYVARGSADGVFPPVCRMAFVTETGDDPFAVGLYVVNPTGTFHHPLAMGGIVHDAGDPAEEATGARCGVRDRAFLPGTWHRAIA